MLCKDVVKGLRVLPKPKTSAVRAVRKNHMAKGDCQSQMVFSNCSSYAKVKGPRVLPKTRSWTMLLNWNGKVFAQVPVVRISCKSMRAPLIRLNGVHKTKLSRNHPIAASSDERAAHRMNAMTSHNKCKFMITDCDYHALEHGIRKSSRCS